MKVLLADVYGFCVGVRRAVRKAEEAAAGGEVASLGQLIHNPQEVERLAARGVRTVAGLEEVPGEQVVIRAHGAPPAVYEEAARRGLRVVDATCPFVLSLQRRARALADEGYHVVVVGDPHHPEVVGVMGWIGRRGSVVSAPEEVDGLPPLERVGVVAQTTQRREKVDAVVARLREKAQEVRVENTICHATWERQEAARRLAGRVDVMVVVGGRGSSNAQKLVAVCRDGGARTYHIETAEELRAEWLRGARAVGVTAGASTPEWIVKEVVARMEELVGTEQMEPRQETVEAAEAAETAGAPGEAAGTANAPGEAGETAAPRAEADADTGGREAAGPGEAELAAAQARLELERAVDREVPRLRPGQVVEGTVVQVAADHLLVDVGQKSEGVVSLGEMSLWPGQSPADVFSAGQTLRVVVLGVDENEGQIRLSQRRFREREAWRRLEAAHRAGEEVEGRVREVVKGGLVLDLGLRAFMPASQVDNGHVPDLSVYLGETLRAKVIELDRANRRVILSRRRLLESDLQQRREALWAELEPGQVRRGVVKSVTDFGVFVDLGGLDGLVHVSELSWRRVRHPSEVVRPGDEVEVKILGLDREAGRISLGMKQVRPDPWEGVEERYQVGETFDGRVVRLVPFGAFVELEPGVEGLVHVSELAERRVSDPAEVVQEGDQVRVRVLKISEEDRRISLSMRPPRGGERPGRSGEPRSGRRPGRRVAASGDGGRLTVGDVMGDVLSEARERLNGQKQ